MSRDRFRQLCRGLSVPLLLCGVLVGSATAASAAPRPAVPYDPTFTPAGAPAGIVTTNFGATPEQLGAEVADMALQADGKIVIAGSRFETVDQRPGIVLRYEANGTPTPRSAPTAASSCPFVSNTWGSTAPVGSSWPMPGACTGCCRTVIPTLRSPRSIRAPSVLR
jgi:hypothetical protein